MEKGKTGGTGLETHVAATLAYLGGWISGLIFLLLESSNRVVRFHAMQSIITFGPLCIVIGVLGWLTSLSALTYWHGALLPVSLVFTVLWALTIAFSIVLWILLLVRSYHRQHVLLPLAGDLAFWMMERSGMETPERDAMAFQGLRGKLPRHEKHVHERFGEGPVGRTVGSIAAIVWCVFLFVLFNFFADYVAFYHSSSEGGVTQLLRYPLLTRELSRVLPVLNLALGISVLGHLVVLSWNKYLVKELVQVITHVMGLAVAIVFLRVFPFDYGSLPASAVTTALPTLTVVILAIAIVGNVIEIIVHFVRLISGFLTR